MTETMTITNQTPSPAGSSNPPTTSTTPRGNKRPSQPRVPLHQLYALPAPIRTFPLPTFYPNNPISLVHLVYAWVKQIVSPPPAEPSIIHQGVWDPATRSVHVKDPKSIRALWEQGFFGKGSLSRSEPNWLKREQNRRDATQATRVSEQHTESRREERRLAKWERAKAELEAIERQRQEEANASAPLAQEEEIIVNGELEVNGQKAPVTPEDLLGLPNSSLVVVEEQKPSEEQEAVLTVDVNESLPVLNGSVESRAPVTPADLLALPNSLALKSVLKQTSTIAAQPNGHVYVPRAPVSPHAILALPNSLVDLIAASVATKVGAQETAALRDHLAETLPVDNQTNGHVNGSLLDGDIKTNGHVNGIGQAKGHANGAAVNGINGKTNGEPPAVPSPPSNGSVETASDQKTPVSPLKRRKSVRFSPQVESTTFQHTDPPSPNRSANSSVRGTPLPIAESNGPVAAEGALPSAPVASSSQSTTVSVPLATVPAGELVDKEHFQLAPEEAFFLVFALGALSVVDPVTGASIPTDQLLTLFRSHSYFPPRVVGSPVNDLLPSDTFLVQYAVYHHFRSLGWVPRHGIKFGVDFILYQRGPVFDHSEFGLIIIPSFSDPRWEDHEHDTPKKSWSWLMGVNRVLSHVLKSLVLIYVDVPPPPVFEELVRNGGIAEALKAYKIREVMVRRFSVNRNR